MNKLIIAMLISGMSFTVNATEVSSLPTKGLTIVPMAKLNIPEEIKVQVLKNKAEEKQKGYHEMDNTYAQYLIMLKRNAPSEVKASALKKDVYDTHLKNDVSHIKLAFSFKPLMMIKNDNIIGYAPIGSYVQENKKDLGWSGIKMFFTDPQLGSCAYSFFDLKISHGAIQLNTETTQYLVNKKPSSTSVEGGFNSGFVYDINWFDETKMHELECANMSYDKDMLPKVIALASQIDGR